MHSACGRERSRRANSVGLFFRVHGSRAGRGMRRSLVISGTAHAVLLVWGLIAFVARPSEAPLADPLPVEFVSATEFSQLTAGVKNAPKPIDNAKPLADKAGEPKPGKEPGP